MEVAGGRPATLPQTTRHQVKMYETADYGPWTAGSTELWPLGGVGGGGGKQMRSAYNAWPAWRNLLESGTRRQVSSSLWMPHWVEKKEVSLMRLRRLELEGREPERKEVIQRKNFMSFCWYYNVHTWNKTPQARKGMLDPVKWIISRVTQGRGTPEF